MNNIIFRLNRKKNNLCNFHISKKFIEIQVPPFFHNAAPIFDGPELWEILS